MEPAVPGAFAAHFFDGRSSRAWPVRISVAQGRLLVTHSALGLPDTEFALADVHWPERSRHGARIAQLPGGASLQSVDVGEWDGWVAHHVGRGSLVVLAQQSWRGVLLALCGLVIVLAGAYFWALPLAARAIVALVPPQVDAALGERALRSMDGNLLTPSRLPQAEQDRIRGLFQRAVASAHRAQGPAWRLDFRRGRVEESVDSDPTGRAGGQSKGRGKSAIGPNAFALPGGTMVLTDELVELVKSDDILVGVLGHELGHVRQRHGMRQLVQVSALGAAASLVFGDYATFISSAPVMLASMGYSRDAEREADDESVRVMKAAGISPLVMSRFFEAVRGERGSEGGGRDPLGIAFSSHPHDADRIERFRQAAQQ